MLKSLNDLSRASALPAPMTNLTQKLCARIQSTLVEKEKLKLSFVGNKNIEA